MKIKKLFKSIIVMTLVLSLCIIENPILARAYNYEKCELDTEITGVLQSASDTKRCEFKTLQDGYVVLNFRTTGLKDDINDGWVIVIEDKNHKECAKYTGVNSDFNSRRLTFGKDQIFYVVVSCVYDTMSSWSPVDVPFSIKVEQTNPENWETENNDTFSRANTLIEGNKTLGTIWLQNDVDIYKYKITENGYTKFNFMVEEENSEYVSDGWKIEYFDAKQKLIYSIGAVESDCSSRYFNFKKNTEIYIKVSTYSFVFVSDAPIDCQYSITPETTADANWELESNDKISQATKLTKSKIGTVYNTSDVDYYSYKATKTKKYSLQILVDDSEGKIAEGLNVVVYSSDGKKKLVSQKEVTNDIKLKFKATKGKKYFVCVSAEQGIWSSAENVKYKVTVK